MNLARQYAATGDARFAQKLVATNLHLVMKVAFELAAGRDDFEDLVQEGNVGLLHAVRKFDPRRGARLTTYAIWWIRAFIKRQLMENRGVVRTGTTRAQRKDFFAGRGTPRDVSLDQPAGQGVGDGTPPSRLDLLSAPEEEQPDRLVEDRDLAVRRSVSSGTSKRGWTRVGGRSCPAAGSDRRQPPCAKSPSVLRSAGSGLAR